MTALAFHSVSKSYPVYRSPSDRLKELATFQRWSYHRDFWALKEVTFEARRGSVFCIVGENGSGKSTALQLAAGIFPPTKGEVHAGGRVSALLELGAGFNPEFTGRDNVFLSAALMGLSTRQIRQRYADIERFAEIGDFIRQPVKTYSSGMLVRLAFSVAIHADPEILLVDEALAVGDYYFRQRCLRKVHELRSRDVTILFVSHNLADVKALGDQALWLEHGRCVEIGRPADVVARYLAHMADKDAAYAQSHPSSRKPSLEPESDSPQEDSHPQIVDTIPNVDRRHGNRSAEILGIAALGEDGRRRQLMEPDSLLTIRVSFRAREPLAAPVAGVTVRNHVGLEFAGTSSARENVVLPPLTAGQVCTVDFQFEIPQLYPGNFSFSPYVKSGPGDADTVCDWIDNALALQMAHRGRQVYGHLHLPCRVAVNGRLQTTGGAETFLPRWVS